MRQVGWAEGTDGERLSGKVKFSTTSNSSPLCDSDEQCVKGIDDTGTVWGGAAGDIPCPGDYFGDGKTHYAYYRAGTLYVMGGTNITLGVSGDKILNLPYSIRSVYFP